jgi:hypothetical protein
MFPLSSCSSTSSNSEDSKNVAKKYREVQNGNHIGNVYANLQHQFKADAVAADLCPQPSPRTRIYRPTTLHYNTYKPAGSSRPAAAAKDPAEANYATIGGSSKRLMPHLKTANV